MKILETLQQALVEQLNFELHSAHLYLAMSAYLDRVGLRGSAAWMRVQSGEEQAHAQKFYGYVYERGGVVLLESLPTPPPAWESPLDCFEAALRHERMVTERIYRLVDLSTAQRDHATTQFLQWFVAEQVEEEASVDEIVQQIKMLEGSKGGLYMLDRQLGKRAKQA